MRKQTLAIIAMFRNEAHILKEWLDHHIKIGVSKFYLLNDRSDDEYLTVLQPYLNKELVVLKHVDSTVGDFPHGTTFQIEEYNKHLNDIKEDWIINADLDEFFYYDKLYLLDKELSVLGTLDRMGVDQLFITQKYFNSNGLDKQPVSVKEGFTERVVAKKSVRLLNRYLVKRESVLKLTIAFAIMKPGSKSYTHDLIQSTEAFNLGDKIKSLNIPMNIGYILNLLNNVRYIDESTYETGLIQCNHYITQSKEWFFGVKLKRGHLLNLKEWEGEDTTKVIASKWNEVHNVETKYDDEILEW